MKRRNLGAGPRGPRKAAMAAMGLAFVLGGLPAARALPASAGVAGGARFVSLAPARILDTRANGDAPFNPKGYVNAQSTITVQVTGNGGVPAGASAVAMNVTATEAGGKGFITVWPSDAASMPEASNLNIERVGQTIPNLVVVQLSGGGSVNVFAQSGAHLIADVAGYWVPAGTATAGRFVPARPTRMMDTREGVGVRPGKLAAGETVSMSLASVEKGPYSAAVLNVTATESNGQGYVTVWPGDGAQPTASNLNLERAGQTIPNLVIVRLGADSTVKFFAQAGTHLIADLVGVFTTASAANNAEGLFTPQPPDRIADSRKGQGFAKPGFGETVGLAIPNGASIGAVLANVTATQSNADGYVSVFPGGTAWPGSSNLNLERADQTIPNLVVSGVGADGSWSLLSQKGTHLLVDVAGTFSKAAPITPVPPPPTNGSVSTFKVFLVSPSDAPASPSVLDLTLGIKRDIQIIQNWLPTQADGRKFRIAGPDTNSIDVPHQVLAYPSSRMTADTLYREQVAAGQLGPGDIGLFWVRGKAGNNCTGNLPRQAVFIFMPACNGGLGSYPSASDGPDFPAGMSFDAAHEMLHVLGAVPTCARDYDGSAVEGHGGHVNAGADHRDIMYQGIDRDFVHPVIDPGHRDYYGANIPGCYDLKTDPIWTS